MYTRQIPNHGTGRLGRHVEHDPRSRNYSYRRSLPITSVQHMSYIDILDQGQLGSCTGNAAVGALGYAPFWESLSASLLDEDLAISVYSQATVEDSFPGVYPPTDTGSSGLAVAKVLQGRGLISGYRWMFSYLDALGALMQAPVIVGTNWYEGMFYPDATGRVTISGAVAGGHEYILDGYDAEAGKGFGGVVWCRNSWGADWGVQGRFAMFGATLQRLLEQDGDAILFSAADEPAPVPVPPDPPAQGCLGWGISSIKGWLSS